MKTWWRVIAGIGAGAADVFANGGDWKHVLAGLLMAGMGIVSHLTSTSDTTTASGKKPA